MDTIRDIQTSASFCSLPADVQSEIFNIALGDCFSEVSNWGFTRAKIDINNLTAICKDTTQKTKALINKKVEDTKKCESLYKKYYAYAKIDTSRNNILLDALSSGLADTSGPITFSFKSYTKDIDDDVRQVVELMPKSLERNGGYMHSKDICSSATPLFLACINPQVSLETVNFLLLSGARPQGKIRYFSGCEIPVLDCLKLHTDEQRLNDILKLFNCYIKTQS